MGGKEGQGGGFRSGVLLSCPALLRRPPLLGRERLQPCGQCRELPLPLQLWRGARPALPLPGGLHLSCGQRSSPSAWPGSFPAWCSVPLHQAKVSRSSWTGVPGWASSRHIPGAPSPCPEDCQCWRGDRAFQGGGCCLPRFWVHPQHQQTWLSLHLGVTPETPTISALAVPQTPRAESVGAGSGGAGYRVSEGGPARGGPLDLSAAPRQKQRAKHSLESS